MKIAPAGFALALSLLLPVHLASAQTAEEVIEKSITALGGRPAHAKLKSRSTLGTIVFSTPAGEISGTVEVLNAAPNKLRTLIKADLSAVGAGQLVVDQRFDGSTGYVLDTMQGNRDITGNQLDNMQKQQLPASIPELQGHGHHREAGRQGEGWRSRSLCAALRADRADPMSANTSTPKRIFQPNR